MYYVHVGAPLPIELQPRRRGSQQALPKALQRPCGPQGISEVLGSTSSSVVVGTNLELRGGSPPGGTNLSNPIGFESKQATFCYPISQRRAGLLAFFSSKA